MWKYLILLSGLVLVIAGCDPVTGAPAGANASKNENVQVTHLTGRDLEDDCPVGLVSGQTLDDEFGPGTQALTRCLERRNLVRVVYQVNRTCIDNECTKPYALGNINNALKDYEITHDLVINRDFKLVMVVYSNGYRFALDNNAAQPFEETNPFQDQIEKLLDAGVEIYLCQNSARGKGIVTANLIPGVRYVTSGVTAIADFQLLGYAVVQP